MIREMLIADVLKLPSVDSHGAMFGGSYSSWSLNDALAGKDVNGFPYDDIRAEIIHDGYNRIPLHVDYGHKMASVYTVVVPEGMEDGLMFGNGHHRLKIMIQEGFETVRVTDDKSESTDDPQEADQYWTDDTDCDCPTGCNCWSH